MYGNINQVRFIDLWKGETSIATTQKLLDCANQEGCSVCRITSFNTMMYNLKGINTIQFI